MHWKAPRLQPSFPRRPEASLSTSPSVFIVDHRLPSATSPGTFREVWPTKSRAETVSRVRLYCVTAAHPIKPRVPAPFLQTLPGLVTPLKGHSLSPRSCPCSDAVSALRKVRVLIKLQALVYDISNEGAGKRCREFGDSRSFSLPLHPICLLRPVVSNSNMLPTFF